MIKPKIYYTGSFVAQTVWWSGDPIMWNVTARHKAAQTASAEVNLFQRSAIVL